MLSDNEKRQLRLIEQQLEQESPGFANELRNAHPHRTRQDRGWLQASAALFGSTVFVLGLLTGSALCLVAGLVGGALVFVVRSSRENRTDRRHDDG